MKIDEYPDICDVKPKIMSFKTVKPGASERGSLNVFAPPPPEDITSVTRVDKTI
jgi:hypothetical protein